MQFLPRRMQVKITKTQLRRIIKEEAEKLREQDQSAGAVDHHFPSADQEIGQVVDILADAWHEMELKSWSAGDPSMNMQGELSDSESKEFWSNQVDVAADELDETLRERLRAEALSVMQEFTDKLINGDYAR